MAFGTAPDMNKPIVRGGQNTVTGWRAVPPGGAFAGPQAPGGLGPHDPDGWHSVPPGGAFAGPQAPGVGVPHAGTGGASTTPRGGRPSTQKAPTPFDPEYYARVANYLYKTNAGITTAQQAQGQDRVAEQAALSQLQYAQPRAQLGLEERANQLGSLYSTPYAQQQSDLAYQYAGKEGGVANAYGGKIADLAQKIAMMRGSIVPFENEEGLASAGRLSKQAMLNKALGESSAPLTELAHALGGRVRSGGKMQRTGRSRG